MMGGVLSHRRVVRGSAAVAAATLASMLVGIWNAGAVPSKLYVDMRAPTCSDGGPGSASKPFCTIDRAARVAIAGQTVLVSSGTYLESLEPANSGTATRPIRFKAAPGATVTLTGQVNGIEISSARWIVVRGFRVFDTSGPGIRVKNSTHITVVGNTVSYAGDPTEDGAAKGIRLVDTTDSLVASNVTHHNSDAGIYLSATTTRVVVRDNRSYANARGYIRAAAGVDVRGPDNTVDGNITYDNEDSGINIWKGAHGCLVVNNVSYSNGDHGIDVLQSTEARVMANTVYGNVDSGIEVQAGSATLANNISVDNGINSPRTSGNIRVTANAVASTTVDFDLVFLTVPGVMIDWAGTKYSSLAAFQSATGQEDRGMEAPPLWVAPQSGDFRLLVGSPAIDSADSGVIGQPDTDVDGHPRYDHPLMPNTGTGPVPYDDRGAYEYQAM
jgi:parallel beta-helix repeat protein